MCVLGRVWNTLNTVALIGEAGSLRLLAGNEPDPEMAQPIQRARQALRRADSNTSARSYRSLGGVGGDEESDLEVQTRERRDRSERLEPQRKSFEGHMGLLFSPGSLERDHDFAPRAMHTQVWSQLQSGVVTSSFNRLHVYVDCFPLSFYVLPWLSFLLCVQTPLLAHGRRAEPQNGGTASSKSLQLQLLSFAVEVWRVMGPGWRNEATPKVGKHGASTRRLVSVRQARR